MLNDYNWQFSANDNPKNKKQVPELTKAKGHMTQLQLSEEVPGKAPLRLGKGRHPADLFRVRIFRARMQKVSSIKMNNFSLFGCAHGLWKFPRWGWNTHHNSNQSYGQQQGWTLNLLGHQGTPTLNDV